MFAKNLNDLLLAAPAGNRTTLGLDPGQIGIDDGAAIYNRYII